jgi:hypothetical protein
VVYVVLGKVVAPRIASNVQRGEKGAGTDNFEKRLDEIKRCCSYKGLLFSIFSSLTGNQYFRNDAHEVSTCSHEESSLIVSFANGIFVKGFS